MHLCRSHRRTAPSFGGPFFFVAPPLPPSIDSQSSLVDFLGFRDENEEVDAGVPIDETFGCAVGSIFHKSSFFPLSGTICPTSPKKSFFVALFPSPRPAAVKKTETSPSRYVSRVHQTEKKVLISMGFTLKKYLCDYQLEQCQQLVQMHWPFLVSHPDPLPIRRHRRPQHCH